VQAKNGVVRVFDNSKNSSCRVNGERFDAGRELKYGDVCAAGSNRFRRAPSPSPLALAASGSARSQSRGRHYGLQVLTFEPDALAASHEVSQEDEAFDKALDEAWGFAPCVAGTSAADAPSPSGDGDDVEDPQEPVDEDDLDDFDEAFEAALSEAAERSRLKALEAERTALPYYTFAPAPVCFRPRRARPAPRAVLPAKRPRALA
jgi:hypothetical protein